MERFSSNCPIRERGALPVQNRISPAAGKMEHTPAMAGPRRSHRKPPNAFPAAANTARARVAAIPVLQGKETTDPTKARENTQNSSIAPAPKAAARGGAKVGCPALRTGFTSGKNTNTASAVPKSHFKAGKSPPIQSPTAPGATNTPRGAAFPPLPRITCSPAPA